jgi:hypothetical protein
MSGGCPAEDEGTGDSRRRDGFSDVVHVHHLLP